MRLAGLTGRLSWVRGRDSNHLNAFSDLWGRRDDQLLYPAMVSQVGFEPTTRGV